MVHDCRVIKSPIGLDVARGHFLGFILWQVAEGMKSTSTEGKFYAWKQSDESGILSVNQECVGRSARGKETKQVIPTHRT